MIRIAAFLALTLTRQPTHVACLGDSITAGYGAEVGYPARLQQMLPDAQVKAFGAPSTTAGNYGPDPYTASQAYADAGTWITGLEPSAVVDLVILLGTNDAVSAAFDPEAFAADYEALVQHFEGLTSSPRVFLLVPPPVFWDTVVEDDESPALALIASHPGRVQVDLLGPFTDAPWLSVPNDVHPNDFGHHLIARLVHAAMEAP